MIYRSHLRPLPGFNDTCMGEYCVKCHSRWFTSFRPDAGKFAGVRTPLSIVKNGLMWESPRCEHCQEIYNEYLTILQEE